MKKLLIIILSVVVGAAAVTAGGILIANSVNKNNGDNSQTKTESEIQSIIESETESESESESESGLPHEHEYIVQQKKDATCTESGYTIYVCKDCGDEYRDTISPLGHNWGEWTVITPATETTSGEERRICSRNAEHTETRQIPGLKHTHKLSKTDSVSATCTGDGNIEYWYCADCGNYFSDGNGENMIAESDIDIPALRHNYGEWEVVKAATCTESGSEQRVCANDNTHIETRTISLLGHNYEEAERKDAECEQDG